MEKQINVVVEYNQNGFLMYAENYCGAYTRGRSEEESLAKFQSEIEQYLNWKEESNINRNEKYIPVIVQKQFSDLEICNADSDIIFDTEKIPFSRTEYDNLKQLIIKSAKDFYELYNSIPEKNYSSLPVRKTFYGPIPRTAAEMYIHTNKVTSYYVGELGVEMDDLEDIFNNRIKALEGIEDLVNYLDNKAVMGSYNEMWSVRKVLRRFLWHDRIHAKAMYRMAVMIWGKDIISNPFYFK